VSIPVPGHPFSTVATLLGNPIYWREPYRDHTPAQLAELKALGFNTVFVNLAWSRPWMDAVTLPEVAISPTYPWLSDPAVVEGHRKRLRARVDAVVAAGLRPFFLFGCPSQIEKSRVPAEHMAATEPLLGQRVSRIDPRMYVACIESPETRRFQAELLADFLSTFPETAGLLFYTVDELAEVCDEGDDCPACQGVPLHERLPAFLGFLADTISSHAPHAEMWWEPWEFSATQTYEMVERLPRGIKLGVHSALHEVYYVNQPDLWLRHLARLAADRGIEIVVELFLSGAGEDLGPVAAFPCPRLVYEQLRSVAALPAVTGVKEYFGTVAEHISVNDRMLEAFLRSPDAPCEELVRGLAAGYREAAGLLLAAWEQASRAVEAYPWDVSWRLRHYNSVRYDQQMGDGYWRQGFVSSLPTPWTTPSWESSRYAAYIVARNAGAVNPRLLRETDARLGRAIHHLDAALTGLEMAQALPLDDLDDRLCFDLKRQACSVRVLRCLALSRRYHLAATQLAAQLRRSPNEAARVELGRCLRADLENARRLLVLIKSNGFQGFDVPAFEHTISDMAKELDAYAADSQAWTATYLLDEAS
jgi:hypothetical protein